MVTWETSLMYRTNQIQDSECDLILEILLFTMVVTGQFSVWSCSDIQ